MRWHRNVNFAGDDVGFAQFVWLLYVRSTGLFGRYSFWHFRFLPTRQQLKLQLHIEGERERENNLKHFHFFYFFFFYFSFVLFVCLCNCATCQLNQPQSLSAAVAASAPPPPPPSPCPRPLVELPCENLARSFSSAKSLGYKHGRLNFVIYGPTGLANENLFII